METTQALTSHINPSQVLKYITLTEFAETNIERISKCSYIDRLLTVKPYKDWNDWVELRFLYKAD